MPPKKPRKFIQPKPSKRDEEIGKRLYKEWLAKNRPNGRAVPIL